MTDKGRVPRHNNLVIQSHQEIEEHLLKYRGLSLWVKQMDPRRHAEIQTVCYIKFFFFLFCLVF